MSAYPSYWKSGSWKAQCDRCGFDFKAERLQKEWTGLRVCPDCFEERHPQEFQRAVRDVQAPPWTRPAVDKHLSSSEFFEEDYVTQAGVDENLTTGFNRTYSVSGGSLVDGGINDTLDSPGTEANPYIRGVAYTPTYGRPY